MKMEYKQIINGNKLIAEFMGYKSTGKETGEPTYIHENMEKGTIIWAGQFGYEKDWNLLMKVIDKIEGMKGIRIIMELSGCAIYSFGEKIASNGGEERITNCYKSVVAFIEHISKK